MNSNSLSPLKNLYPLFLPKKITKPFIKKKIMSISEKIFPFKYVKQNIMHDEFSKIFLTNREMIPNRINTKFYNTFKAQNLSRIQSHEKLKLNKETKKVSPVKENKIVVDDNCNISEFKNKNGSKSHSRVSSVIFSDVILIYKNNTRIIKTPYHNNSNPKIFSSDN